MDQNRNDVKKTSRRTFAQSLGATAGAIPFLTLISLGQGCKTQKKDEPRIKQSSPITIGGGGSVWIKFDPNYYKQVSGKPNSFVNDKGDTLHKWRVLKKLTSPPEWKTPSNSNCRIVVHCIDPRGMDSSITVYGSPMGIEFDVTQFTRQLVPDIKEEAWYNKDRKIQGKIEFWPAGATTAEEEEAPADGICLIDLMDRL